MRPAIRFRGQIPTGHATGISPAPGFELRESPINGAFRDNLRPSPHAAAAQVGTGPDLDARRPEPDPGGSVGLAGIFSRGRAGLLRLLGQRSRDHSEQQRVHRQPDHLAEPGAGSADTAAIPAATDLDAARFSQWLVHAADPVRMRKHALVDRPRRDLPQVVASDRRLRRLRHGLPRRLGRPAFSAGFAAGRHRDAGRIDHIRTRSPGSGHLQSRFRQRRSRRSLARPHQSQECARLGGQFRRDPVVSRPALQGRQVVGDRRRAGFVGGMSISVWQLNLAVGIAGGDAVPAACKIHPAADAQLHDPDRDHRSRRRHRPVCDRGDENRAWHGYADQPDNGGSGQGHNLFGPDTHLGTHQNAYSAASDDGNRIRRILGRAVQHLAIVCIRETPVLLSRGSAQRLPRYHQ